MLRVYVAAPYEDAPLVRAVHGQLLALGMTPTSTWASHARGAEDLHADPPETFAELARSNDDDILRSDAVLVLARAGAGGEMFCEARFALVLGKPVVWVGRRVLSAYRAGVRVAEELDDAMGILHGMAAVRVSA